MLRFGENVVGPKMEWTNGAMVIYHVSDVAMLLYIISQTNAIQWNDMSMWQRREVISDRFFSPQIHFRFDSFRNGWTCMSMANEMSSSVVDDIYAMLLCTQGSSVLCLMIQRR